MFNIDVDKLLMINIAVDCYFINSFSCYNKFFDCFT